jgi:hypothetical protein
MLARTKERAEAVARPLAARIAELHRRIEEFIEGRVSEAKLAFPDLPRQTLRQSLIGGQSCQCAAALKVIEDYENDREIARRHGG